MSLKELQKQLNAVDSSSDLPELKSKVEFLAFIIRTVNSMEDLDSVLRVLMDGAITLVGAERGFILFHTPSGELEFRVARGVEQSELTEDRCEISRTLVDRVLQLSLIHI